MEDKSDEECWKALAEDYDNRVDADGNIYSTYNKDSKWDWYCEGGRFSGMLTANGQQCDSARVGDIDFSPDEKVYNDSLRFWDLYVDEKPLKPGEERPNPFYRKEYYIGRYGDRETYAKCCAQFETYAVVLPTGLWFAPGNIGWWGMSSETDNEYQDWCKHYKERFIDTADPSWYLTIVDCHI